jgi:hypothetical protein
MILAPLPPAGGGGGGRERKVRVLPEMTETHP